MFNQPLPVNNILLLQRPIRLVCNGGITNGELDETVNAATKIDAETGLLNKYDPAILGKLGYDKQVNKDFRFRLTGSFYTLNSGNGNTLMSSDRTGSHYFDVMENQAVANATVLNDANDHSPFSGRLNPGFSLIVVQQNTKRPLQVFEAAF